MTIELTLEQFKARGFQPCDMLLHFARHPGVFRSNHFGAGATAFMIRIKVGESWNGRTGSSSLTYDYFELNEDGLILKSPRGFARQYNGRVRITDIAEAAGK